MKVANPTCFPEEGVYKLSGMNVNLLSATDGAVIHYTMDGSDPTREGKRFVFEEGLIPLPSQAQPDAICRTTTVIKAIAIKPGMEDSDIITFTFHIDLAPSTQYRYSVIEQAPGGFSLFRVEDYDRDKMYFLRGTERGLLIDLGNDPHGDLKGFVDMLAQGIPYDAIVTHGHPDHIAQGSNMMRAGIQVFMNQKDSAIAAHFGADTGAFLDIREGAVFPLGGHNIRVHEVPGHTPGCLVLVDERNGYVYASDALGNGRAEIPDSGWLQFRNPESAMDRYLHAIQRFRSRTAGQLTKFFGGHNHNILEAELYLKQLEMAVQSAVDRGWDVAIKTIRSKAISFGSEKMVVTGNYMRDLHWVGVNLGLLYSENLSAGANARLSWLELENATLAEDFSPEIVSYILQVKDPSVPICVMPISSSTQATLLVNGQPCKRCTALDMMYVPGGEIHIVVTAPNAQDTQTYLLRMA